MKILVTGGAGFIGSAVIRHIIESTVHTVINIDKLTYAGNLESLESITYSERYFFEKTDINNPLEVQSVFDKYTPDAVMHLAAESHVDRSIEGPEIFIKTNILGTYNLLEISRKYWMSIPKDLKNNFVFHHVSTDEVYGDLKKADSFFTEETPYSPNSPYSASKAGSDHLVRSWSKTYGLPVIITNCSNNYGPFHFPEKLIPHVIINALKGEKIPIYGNGLQVRDWLYVEDHANALIQVINSGYLGNTFNIGGHNEKTNLEVVENICELLEELAPEKPSNIKYYKDLITYVKDRPGHDERYAIDASKIKDLLGWEPKETFESGLEKTVSWYLNNRGWWERVLSGDYKLERIGKLD